MGQADLESGRIDPVAVDSRSSGFGLRFVVAVTVIVVAFGALVAFAMYWLAPLQ